jgi:hypothetical protein
MLGERGIQLDDLLVVVTGGLVHAQGL